MPTESVRPSADVVPRLAIRDPDQWLAMVCWLVIAFSSLSILLFSFGRDQGIYGVVIEPKRRAATRCGRYTLRMKTAISLPDDLFRAVDAKARALKMSRSRLLAQAAREFIEKRSPVSVATEASNRAIARAGQPGDDAAAAAFRRRTKRVVRGSWPKR